MGIPVGRSFEIAYAQLRMLFFLCRDVRRMAVRNRLSSVADAIVLCRDVRRMVVRNRLCSASDTILSLPGWASDGRSKSLILHFTQTTKEFVTEEYDFTPSAACGLRKACILLAVSYFLEVIWKQRCLRSYFT